MNYLMGDAEKLDQVYQDIVNQCENGLKIYVDQNYFNNNQVLVIDQPNTHIIFTSDVICEFERENNFLPHRYISKYQGKEYTLGFFALIVIKCHNVIIDLNGFEIKWSELFALQQRWGTIIELASSPFIPSQGPGNFGSIQSARRVIIRHGKLGRSPHHHIHGNDNQWIFIHDITSYDHEVSSIHLNGVKSAMYRDIIIMHNCHHIPVVGKYSAFRFLILFTKQLLDNLIEKQNVPRSDIDNLTSYWIDLMTMNDYCIDEYINTGKIPLEDFYNESGLIDGTSYGICHGKNGVQIRDFKKRQCPVSQFIQQKSINPDNNTDMGYKIISSGKQYNDNDHYPVDMLRDCPRTNTSHVFMQNIDISGIYIKTNEFTGITRTVNSKEMKKWCNQDDSLVYNESNVTENECPSIYHPSQVIVDPSGSVYDLNVIYQSIKHKKMGKLQSNLLWYQLQVTRLAIIHQYNFGVSNISLELVDYLLSLWEQSDHLMNNHSTEISSNRPGNLYVAWPMNQPDINHLRMIGYHPIHNIDSMNHIIKGMFGIRLDDTVNYHLDNIRIYDMKNQSELGNQFNYDRYDPCVNDRYTYLFTDQVNPGYRGTNCHGIHMSACVNNDLSRIKIDNLFSRNGPVTGLCIMNGCQDIHINQIECNQLANGHVVRRMNGIGIVKGTRNNIIQDMVEECDYIKQWPNMYQHVDEITIQDSIRVYVKDMSCGYRRNDIIGDYHSTSVT